MAIGASALPKITLAEGARTSPAGGCNPTTLDLYGQGPFYTAGAPTMVANQLAAPGEPGTRLTISGTVMNLDCSQILPSTEIDVWHANDAGDYDNVGYNLRGVTTSNVSGFYIFETIYPGKYLNGSSYRPAHIHFRITPPGFPLLITQLYFQGDSDIPGDAAASVTSGTYDATHRIIPVTPDGSGGLEGTWDIMIDGSGTPVGVDELHLENGMIYQANPNPFIDEVTINYGVFKEAKVQIDVYNVHGQLVADLGAEIHAPDKYSVVWQPEIELPSGHYFISLKMNDMQVHYIKVVKA